MTLYFNRKSVQIKFFLFFCLIQGTTVQPNTPDKKEEEEDDDDDFDLFGSDEDEEADQIKQQRLKEYAERKAKKPAIIAKSSILLDVKPVSPLSASSLVLIHLTKLSSLRRGNIQQSAKNGMFLLLRL